MLSKIVHSIFALGILFLFSCELVSPCKNLTCPKDITIPGERQRAVEFGDELWFQSVNGEVIQFTLTNRNIDEWGGSLDSRESECCPSYTFEVMTWAYTSSDSTATISHFLTHYVHEMKITLGEDFSFSCLPYTSSNDEPQAYSIAGIQVNGLFKVDCYEDDDAIFIDEEGKLRGFIINNEEWVGF